MWWILLAISILTVSYVIGLYRRFVALRHTCDEAFAAIDLYLTERHELLPTVLQVTEPILREQSMSKRLMELQKKAMQAETIEEQIPLEQEHEYMLLTEVKLAKQVVKGKHTLLQELLMELAQIESDIHQSRAFYNASVLAYNQCLAGFPRDIVAQRFGFAAFPYFSNKSLNQ